LPDKLYGVLAVNWKILDQLLEDRLARVDTEAVRITKELHRTFELGQAALSSQIRQRVIAVNLSDREHQVAKLVAFGFKNRQIADRLGIGASTVKTTIQRIMTKTGLTDRTDFVHIL
jgi:DNA-binding NarL/FixJ family response regulator